MNASERRVLIVDDCSTNVLILKKLLRDKYALETAASGEECLEKLPRFAPDLVLLDIMMPGIDGYETCRRIKSSPLGGFTHVMLVSAKGTTEERLKGYEVGADDYLVKPFDHEELLAKVRIQFRLHEMTLQLWSANNQIRHFNAELERLVAERSAEVVGTRDLAIFALAKLAESRDSDTGEHLDRMRNYARMLAEQLAREGPYSEQIDAQTVEDVYRSSPLHDIGKVGIPDAILLKPGKLTKGEFEIMKRHCEIGAEALEQVVQRSDCGSFLSMAIDVCRSHHEHFDGKGYPHGLAGQEIPLAARIVAVADVYDALTTDRVYKAALPPEDAFRIIEEEEGEHFDPVVVGAFRARFPDFLALAAEEPPAGALAATTAEFDLRR